MLAETPAQLVAHLEHPNGWWRDTAQKMLVVKGDKSVVPALMQMARTDQNHLARIHALWTLEGLGVLDAEVIRAFLNDQDAQIRAQGIRVAERLILTGDTKLLPEVQAFDKDADPTVVLQVLMTGKLLSSTDAKLWPDYTKFAQQTMLQTPSVGVRTLGMMLLTGTDKVGGQEFSGAEIAVLEKGQAIFKEVCFACHGFDGRGMPMDGLRPGTTIAPPLAGSLTVRSHPDAVPLVLLNGLAGPTGGKTYDAQMVPMNTNDDEWIAAVASYVRNAFGNHGAMVAPTEVKRLRDQTTARKEPWTIETLRAALPQPLDGKSWKITASENPETAGLVADGKTDTRWQTAGEQRSGQWIEVELPEEAAVSGIRLDQSKAQGDYPRAYRVEVSLDGRKWTRVAEATGLPGASEKYFEPTKARFVKITLTGAQRGKPWTICELELFPGTAGETAR